MNTLRDKADGWKQLRGNVQLLAWLLGIPVRQSSRANLSRYEAILLSYFIFILFTSTVLLLCPRIGGLTLTFQSQLPFLRIKRIFLQRHPLTFSSFFRLSFCALFQIFRFPCPSYLDSNPPAKGRESRCLMKAKWKNRWEVLWEKEDMYKEQASENTGKETRTKVSTVKSFVQDSNPFSNHRLSNCCFIK